MRTGRRIAVGVSGGGRSLANLLECQRHGAPFEIAAVIASRPDCKALDIAAAHGLPTFVDNFKGDVAARLYAWIDEQMIAWVALAGFLKLFPLSPRYVGRVVNIHPALLPKFGGPGMYGDRVHAAVLSAAEETSGATVHYVDAKYDEGKIIAQVVVPVRAGDDTRSLADRVFAGECKLYPAVLTQLVEGALPRPDGTILRMTYDV